MALEWPSHLLLARCRVFVPRVNVLLLSAWCRAISYAIGISGLLFQFMCVPLHVLIVLLDLLCLVFKASCSVLEFLSVFFTIVFSVFSL